MSARKVKPANAIKDYLKLMDRHDSRLLQARIPRRTYADLRAKLEKENVTIQDFIEASALAYLKG